MHKNLVALAVGGALLATGCGGDDSSDLSAQDANEADERCTEDHQGGTATMGVFSETRGLDPTEASGSGPAGGTEMAAIYDTLMRFNPDTREYEPRVAESLAPNEDATEWTLTLQSAVTFGNGDPLTTEAVEASLERHLDPEKRSLTASYVLTIEEMEIVDEHTMVFHLHQPWTGFPYLLAEEGGMVTNPAVAEELGDDFSQLPVGAGVGPFEPERFVPGEELVLRPRDDYWGGPVCLEELRFVLVPGASGTYEAFQSDELDVAFIRDPAVGADALDDGVSAFVNQPEFFGGLLINNGAGDGDNPTSDVRVRRALAAAIDPEAIHERLYGHSELATSAITSADSPLWSGVDGPDHDPDLAAELVEEVKGETGWDGTLRLVTSDTTAALDSALAVQAQLEAVGFTIEVDQMPVTDQIRTVSLDADYDIASWGLNINEASPWTTLTQFQSDGLRNRTGYGSPEMDAALEELGAADDEDAVRDALGEVQEAWNETAPSVSFGSGLEVLAHRDDLRGLTPTLESVLLFDGAYYDD